MKVHKRELKNTQTYEERELYYRVDNASLTKLIDLMKADSGEDTFAILQVQKQPAQSVDEMLNELQTVLYSYMRKCGMDSGMERRFQKCTNKLPCNKWYDDNCKGLR